MAAILSPFGSGGGIQPYQFQPETFGAVGNGRVTGDVTSNSSNTYNSPTISADAAAVGKFVMIHGANGALSGPVIGTITGVNSGAGTFTVSGSAAGASVASCPAVWGTDDTAAINSAVTAGKNYALTVSATPGSGGYFAEILFAAKIYILGTGPTQVGNGTSTPTFNAQIPMPFPAANGTSQKLVIALTGAGDAGYCQFWDSLVPNLAGTCLVSMLTTSSTPSPTFGQQSVIGGPSGNAGFTTPAGGIATAQANTKVLVRGLSVWCSIYTNIYAYDFGFVSAMRVERSSAHIFAPTGVNTSSVQPYLNVISAAAFTSSVGSGFRTPAGGNNADTTMDDVTVEGYECNYRLFDHFQAGRLNAIYADVVCKWDSSQGLSGVQHGIFVESFCAEQYNVGFLTNGGTAHVHINWDAEVSGSPTDISDAGNNLLGILRFRDTGRGTPSVSGAAKLKVINEALGSGPWAGAPAAPASAVAQQNTAWRDATVYVSSTVAITAVAVDGIATGQTAAAGAVIPVRVPSGHSYTITAATGTQTTKWVLD